MWRGGVSSVRFDLVVWLLLLLGRLCFVVICCVCCGVLEAPKRFRTDDSKLQKSR